ncbi:MAG: hypothetical protein ACRYE9_06245, partial [Janthinobacterium lividum]
NKSRKDSGLTPAINVGLTTGYVNTLGQYIEWAQKIIKDIQSLINMRVAKVDQIQTVTNSISSPYITSNNEGLIFTDSGVTENNPFIAGWPQQDTGIQANVSSYNPVIYLADTYKYLIFGEEPQTDKATGLRDQYIKDLIIDQENRLFFTPDDQYKLESTVNNWITTYDKYVKILGDNQ